MLFRGGKVGELGVFFSVLGEEFVWVVLEVEQLGFSYFAVEDVKLHEFPIAFFNRTHAGLGATGVGSEHDITDGFFLAGEDGFETDAFVCFGRFDFGEVAEGCEGVHEVDVSLDTAGFDAGSFDDVGDAPGVLVEVLFSLESVAADGHAVV